MLNWLKKVTNYQPAPKKVAEYEARLSAPDGSRELYGDVEFDVYEDGNWKLEIEIEHPKIKPEGPFELRFDGRPVKAFDVAKGFDTEKTFRSINTDIAVKPSLGTRVDVHGANGLLLTGVFANDL